MKRTAMLLIFGWMCLMSAGALALTVTGLETDAIDRQWETNAFFARMETLTGVRTQAHGVNDEEEYAGLISRMEKGDIQSDVLFKANLTREQEYALLDSGAIADLAPYIDTHMPNLSALLAANPQWKEIIALDDGRIASLPLLNTQERQACMWINRKWLGQLGLEMPRTMDELTAALEKIRDGDLNGNGKKDERALDLLGVYEMRWLLPYFGVVADDYHMARDEQGRIVFAPQLPAYRAFIEQVKAWYESGVLRSDAFTSVHSTTALSDSEDETLLSGMLFSMTPYTHVSIQAVPDYVPLLLADPQGNIRWRDLLGEVWTGCFAVTRACEDIGAALRWADALYAQEGALLAYAGVENEDYTVASDGTWSFVLDGRRDINAIRSEVVIYTGAAAPGLYPADFISRVNSSVDRHVFEASESVRAVSEQVIPAYALSRKDQAQADRLAAVLGGLVDRGIARFVTGEVPLDDAHYQQWLDELEHAGSKELAALYREK